MVELRIGPSVVVLPCVECKHEWHRGGGRGGTQLCTMNQLYMVRYSMVLHLILITQFIVKCVSF